MRCVSACSPLHEGDSAAAVVCAKIIQLSAGQALDFAFVCISGRPLGEFKEMVLKIRETLDASHTIAVSSAGTIAAMRELEWVPSVVVWAILEPSLAVRATYLTETSLENDDWRNQLLVSEDDRLRLLFMDPFSIDGESLVIAIQSHSTWPPLVGGLLSGGQRPGEHAMCFDDRFEYGGAFLITLGGQFEVKTAVAQGCRPIGDPMFVTSCEGHRLRQLNSRNPLEVMEELYFSLDRDDRLLFRSSLFIGLEMEPFSGQLGCGDFLVRNVIGVDESTGELMVGAPLTETGVVQFQLRDSKTARGDLLAQLKNVRGVSDRVPSGFLIFACVGRGRGLYGEPHFESRLIASQFGRIAQGGFFCNGEIGPVNDYAYIHGYTTSLAFFFDREGR